MVSGAIAAAWLVGVAAGQTGTAIAQVGGVDALSTPSQRHMVRVVTPGRPAAWLMAVQRDAVSSPHPEGLHWYRSDDEGKTWRYYARILQDGVSGSEVHMTADASVAGEDVLIAISYDTTDTGFPSDSDDPQRKVYFQRWRHDGSGNWSPGTLVTIAAPPSGYAYHRATLARDSIGRVWVTAWLRSPCSESAGAACADALRVWVSTDGGATWSAGATLAQLSVVAGGRLISLGNRLMMLWGDGSWDNPAKYRLRNDSDPVSTWSSAVNAFPDADSIYHGSALSAVADGVGGLHLVYKDRRENLYYRRFNGTSFGPRTFVDGSSTSDWALQPAVTLHRGELYVCTNHPVVALRRHEMRSYRLADNFASYVVLDSSATFKGYPTAPEALPNDATHIPCAYTSGGFPGTLTVAGRSVTGTAPTPNFSISANPTFVAGSGSSTISVVPSGGFSGFVALSVSGAPTGANVSLSSSGVTVGPETGYATLTLQPGTAASGSYSLTVRGTSGGLTRQAVVQWSIAGGNSLQLLVDPFTGPGVNTSLWDVTTLTAGDSANASGGVLSLALAPNNGQAGVYVETDRRYSLSGSQVSVRVLSVLTSNAKGSTRMRVHPSSGSWTNDVGFWAERGKLYATYTRAGASTDAATASYSPTQHAWWRLRASSSTVYWETSPDGLAWSVLASLPASQLSFSLSEVHLSFEVKAWGRGSPSPGTARFTSLNQPPGTQPPPPPDAGTPDAGTADAGFSDAGVPDAGAPDAGGADAGTVDAGAPDAGAADAGAVDAGAPDEGPPDAGTIDAGAPDAGGTPQMSSLRDPFTGPAVDTTKWLVVRDTTGSTATAGGGLLTLALEANTSSAGAHVTSRNAYALTGSSLHARIPTVTSTSAQASVRMVVTTSATSWNTHLGFWYEQGRLYLFYETSGVDTTVAQLTYSATTHAWWRIREQAGQVYWETSADGVSWTVRAVRQTNVLGFGLGSVHARFETKAWGPVASGSGLARFGSLNVGP